MAAAALVKCCRSFSSALLRTVTKNQQGSLYEIQFMSPCIRQNSRSIFSSSIFCAKSTNEGIENNPFYNKYQEKIKKALNEQVEGYEMSDEERKRKFKIDPVMEKHAEIFKESMKKQEGKLERKLGISEKSSSGNKPTYTEKTLDKIMRMDLLADKTGEEIGKLWEEYHRQRDCISAVIPAAVYDQIQKISKDCPLFIHPLPRDQGYEFMYAEFTGDHCYVTSLINFQAFGSEAPWCLALKHYTELKDTKGIVLMVGEIDSDKLDTMEALCIANQIQLYYAGNNKDRLELLHTFNHDPNNFHHLNVLKEFEKSLLEIPQRGA